MLRQFCERINFPAEAVDYLESVFPKTDADTLKRIGEAFLQDEETVAEQLRTEADRCGLPEETVTLFMLIHLFDTVLRKKYTEAGLSEALFWENAEDLTFKLHETHASKGTWGNSALHWYRKFFDLNCIRLGRLQYEESTWQEKDFPPLKQGDQVFKIHIPSSGPLTPESVEASFQRAKKFFKDAGILKTDYIPLMCASWLIYPPHHDVFPQGGNIQKFQELFTVVTSYERTKDFIRIFHRADDGNYNDLPEDTTLQRNFKKFLLGGGKMGLGRGITFR